MKSHPTHELIPLQHLRRGQSAEVVQVLGRLEQVHHLQELGLRGGTTVYMVQPGTPCIIKLSGHSLCFRAAELLRVLVRPVRAQASVSVAVSR